MTSEPVTAGSVTSHLAVVRDLAAQHRFLADLLAGCTEADLDRPTPAVGWAVRHQIAHLADTDEVAADTVHSGPRRFAAAIRPYRSAEEFTAAGVARAQGRPFQDLHEWLRTAQQACRAALSALDPDSRVPWGFGLSATAFAQARLMETWAHTWDVAQALHRPMPLTGGARHVAELGLATLPYALRRARTPPPAGRAVLLDLDAGELGRWRCGPSDATDVISGPALAWVKVSTRRADVADRAALRADGPLAELALRHARAYL